ncbi:MAG: tryptophan synthase subunit beta [Acidobacteria bacterium 37-65-4]|nr:MAG: tryptophan synthase subunit beta [Acidobacteria bacterium 37-65-4]
MPFDLMARQRDFGPFGGRFVPETLMAPLLALEEAFGAAWADEGFRREFEGLLKDYSGRPTPLTHAKRLAEAAGVASVVLKREDLNHTGSHKINNALGQALLAQRMGKRRVIAETGAGQHGVASATACALLGLDCTVYMGEQDMARQAPNVARMRLLGAAVSPVSAGQATLKEAINEALRDWAGHPSDTYYLLGSALGPRPYPTMVRTFQSVIGDEARGQYLAAEGRLPDAAVACVGGGSNAIGLFSAFIEDQAVSLIGVEAGGEGSGPGQHAARFSGGSPGVLHGTLTYLLQDAGGQVLPTASVAAGLDYPAVGPEHSQLFTTGRARYTSVGDQPALSAFRQLSALEGIIPALESAHALAWVLDRAAAELGSDARLLVNLSGRGDKDMESFEG